MKISYKPWVDSGEVHFNNLDNLNEEKIELYLNASSRADATIRETKHFHPLLKEFIWKVVYNSYVQVIEK